MNTLLFLLDTSLDQLQIPDIELFISATAFENQWALWIYGEGLSILSNEFKGSDKKEALFRMLPYAEPGELVVWTDDPLKPLPSFWHAQPWIRWKPAAAFKKKIPENYHSYLF